MRRLSSQNPCRPENPEERFIAACNTVTWEHLHLLSLPACEAQPSAHLHKPIVTFCCHFSVIGQHQLPLENHLYKTLLSTSVLSISLFSSAGSAIKYLMMLMPESSLDSDKWSGSSSAELLLEALRSLKQALGPARVPCTQCPASSKTFCSKIN